MTRTLLALLGAALLILPSCSSDGTAPDPEPEAIDETAYDQSKFEGDADYYAVNAQEYYDAGEFTRARTQFTRWYDIDANATGARLGMAWCDLNMGREYGRVGDLKEANRRFTLASGTFQEIWDGTLPADTLEGSGFGWKACMGLATTERAEAALAKVAVDQTDARLERAKPDEVAGLLEQQRKLRQRRDDYYAKSLTKFEKLAAMKNAAPDALSNLGDLYLVLGREADAERAYLRYLAVAKANVENWEQKRKLAPDYFPSKRRLSEALDIIDRKRTSATRKTVHVLELIAEIKFNKGNYADALDYLTEAKTLDPERYTLDVPMAECHYELQSYEEGLRHIEAFIERSPSFDDETHKAFKLRTKLKQALGQTTAN